MIRDGSLPLAAASLDFRAANLVYVGDAAVLFDLAGAERVPRVLDLAMAALLFHYDTLPRPVRTAARAWSSPGRRRLVPVRPWSRVRGAAQHAMLHMWQRRDDRGG